MVCLKGKAMLLWVKGHGQDKCLCGRPAPKWKTCARVENQWLEDQCQDGRPVPGRKTVPSWKTSTRAEDHF
jgi:hypothetical protein